MKLLHTSDWHVGKTIRNKNRADEHEAALAEIAEIADANEVDVVVVAGDLFDTASPTPESERIVYRALLDLAETGAAVAVIAGNHDNPRRLAAVAPLLDLGKVQLVTQPLAPADGSVRVLEGRSGQEVAIAMLPFVSKRGIVRADELMDNAAYQNAQLYSERMRILIGTLADALPDDLPSVLTTHAFVLGGQAGGGERPAHLVDEYAIASQAFPATVGYVALGHLHRPQRIHGATAIYYSGSPLQIDFGEEAERKQVNVVELAVGTPAKVTEVPLTAGRPLVTLSGSLAELASQLETTDDRAWIRARVDEPVRAGLADEVRELLGERVVDVFIERPESTPRRRRTRQTSRTPQEAFRAFLDDRDIADDRLSDLFDDLYEQVSEATD